jgi:hypothetical protein
MGLNEFHFGFMVGVTAGAGLFVFGIVVGLAARMLDSSISKLRGTRKEDVEDWTDSDFENAFYGDSEPGVPEVTDHSPDLSDETLQRLADLHRHSNSE